MARTPLCESVKMEKKSLKIHSSLKKNSLSDERYSSKKEKSKEFKTVGNLKAKTKTRILNAVRR